MKRSELRLLAHLVFKRGGFAGAVRRIIYRWRGLFTSSMILGKLLRKYPLLIPGDSQLFDCLTYLESGKKIQRILANDCAIYYQLAPYQLWLRL